MGKAARKAYLEQTRARYLKAKRAEKAKILDEFCQVCRYNRKYAIRLLMKPPVVPGKRPGPRPIYQNEAFLTVLKRIWFAADQV